MDPVIVLVISLAAFVLSIVVIVVQWLIYRQDQRLLERLMSESARERRELYERLQGWALSNELPRTAPGNGAVSPPDVTIPDGMKDAKLAQTLMALGFSPRGDDTDAWEFGPTGDMFETTEDAAQFASLMEQGLGVQSALGMMSRGILMEEPSDAPKGRPAQRFAPEADRGGHRPQVPGDGGKHREPAG